MDGWASAKSCGQKFLSVLLVHIFMVNLPEAQDDIPPEHPPVEKLSKSIFKEFAASQLDPLFPIQNL